MILPEFRAIVEYSVYYRQHYYTIQICRPSSSKPEQEASDLKSKNDYAFYIFNRFPLDGFELTGISFKQIVPFVNHFRNGNGKKLKTILKKYSQKKIPFHDFLKEEYIKLNGNGQQPPKTQYPAYEPTISIKEVDINKHGGTPEKAIVYATFGLENKRMFEYAAMLKALGYRLILTSLGYDSNTEKNLTKWLDDNILRWSRRNAQIHRLTNPVANGELDIGDIRFCGGGKGRKEHYWHYVGDTGFIRKFYVIEKEINSRSLEEQINSIPKEKCPDAIDGVVEREGTSIFINKNKGN